MVEPYLAFAVQSKTYGCTNRADIKKNLANLLPQIEGCLYMGDVLFPTKLIVLSEGALQGFYDEHSRMDHVEACKKIAIRIPGEETDRLSEVAKKWGVYMTMVRPTPRRLSNNENCSTTRAACTAASPCTPSPVAGSTGI